MASKKNITIRKTVSGIAGASGGTGILGVAALIPDEYHFLKQAVAFSAPTASVIIGALWAWGSNLLIKWGQRWAFGRSLKAARRLRDEIVTTPTSTNEHKQLAQKRVEALEQVLFGLIDDETQSLRATITVAGTTNPADS